MFTYGRGKGIKGDEASKLLEQNWGRPHIARLFIDGGMVVNVIKRMYGSFNPS